MNPKELKRIIATLGGGAFFANLVAFAAGVSAAVTNLSLPTVVLAFVGMAMTLAPYRHTFLTLHRDVGPLGRELVVRFLLFAGALVVGSDSSQPAVFWLFAAAMAVSLSFEPVLRELSENSAPYTLNVPGIDNRKDTSFGYGMIYVVNSAAVIVAYFAASGALWGVTVFVVAVVIAVLLDAAAALDAIRGNRARKAGERVLNKRLNELQPSFAIYFYAPQNAVFHIGMWLPYLERVGEPFIIIVRNRRNFNEVRAITDRPIVLREAREDLDDVIVPSLRAVFYVNLATKNEHMVWYTHLTHVQMNHGESDKKSSFNPAYKMYDRAFVAGQAGIDRFAENGVDLPDEAFAIVGRPQVENVQVKQRSAGKDGSQTVLYAPTWAGFHEDVSHTSLPVAHDVFSELLKRGCTVIFRPHPFSYRSRAHTALIRRLQGLLAEDAKQTGRNHMYGHQVETEMTIYDCFNAADAMISDVSSVVGDFLFSQKPFAMVAVAAPAAEFHAEFPVSRAGYLIDAHRGRLEGLSEALNELLDTDSLADRRQELNTYYLGDIPSHDYAQEFVRQTRSVIHQPHLMDHHTSTA